MMKHIQDEDELSYYMPSLDFFGTHVKVSTI